MGSTELRRSQRAAPWVVGVAALAIVTVVMLRFGDHPLSSLLGKPASVPAPPPTNLIQRPVEIPPPLPGGDSSVSKTPRALLLTGTEIGARPQDNLAYLGVDRRNPQTYGVGSILANGARITAINADHVVLERDGKTVRLDVSHETTLAQRERPAQNGALDAIGGPPPRMPTFEPSTDAVTEVIRPSPLFDESGRFTGYQLQPGANEAAFARLGLAAGDRLVSVGGVALTDVAQAAQALQSLANGTALTVTVMRGGQVLPLRLDGQILSETAAETSKPAPQQQHE